MKLFDLPVDIRGEWD